MTSFHDFFHMGGYAFYVWTSYGCVMAYLFFQWAMPWRRWKNHLAEQVKSSAPLRSNQPRNDRVMRINA